MYLAIIIQLKNIVSALLNPELLELVVLSTMDTNLVGKSYKVCTDENYSESEMDRLLVSPSLKKAIL